MLLYDSERKKNNEAIRNFIAKLTMITMVKLRNNDSINDSVLPIPRTLEEISKTNDLMESVVKNIIRNELKLYDITDDKELYFKSGSPFSEIDVMSVLEHERDNTDTTNVLGDKLIYTVTFIKNTVLNVIKELINNVKTAKAAYEGSRKAASISIQPLTSPGIIEYYILKGELKDNGEPAVIPSPSDKAEDNTIGVLNNEDINEQLLISDLLEYYAFNESLLKEFLTNFNVGEIIKIAKAYLSDATSNNQNLNMLTIRDLSKTNDLYLVYLLANMFKNKYYSENENLVRLVKTLGQLVFSRYSELKSDVKNDILVEWVDDKKIYLNMEVFNTIDVDVMAIVGAVISENVTRGGLSILAKDVVENSANYIEAFNRYEAANLLETQTGMKNTIVNIFTNEIKKVYEKYKTVEQEDLTELEISGKTFSYLQGKDFKDIVDIDKAAEDLVLTLLYPDEASKLFIQYFTAYSGMEASLTPQDCALLAGTTLVALEIGANLDVK